MVTPTFFFCVLLITAIATHVVMTSTALGWSPVLAKAGIKGAQDYANDLPDSALPTCATQTEILSNAASLKHAYAEYTTQEASCTESNCDLGTATASVQTTCTSLRGSTFAAEFGIFGEVGFCLGNLCTLGEAGNIFYYYIVAAIDENLSEQGVSTRYYDANNVKLLYQGAGTISAAGNSRSDFPIAHVIVLGITFKMLFGLV